MPSMDTSRPFRDLILTLMLGKKRPMRAHDIRPHIYGPMSDVIETLAALESEQLIVVNRSGLHPLFHKTHAWNALTPAGMAAARKLDADG